MRRRNFWKDPPAWPFVVGGLVAGLIAVVVSNVFGPDELDPSQVEVGVCVGNVSVPGADAEVVDCTDPEAELKIVGLSRPCEHGSEYYELSLWEESAGDIDTTSRTFCARKI